MLTSFAYGTATEFIHFHSSKFLFIFSMNKLSRNKNFFQPSSVRARALRSHKTVANGPKIDWSIDNKYFFEYSLDLLPWSAHFSFYTASHSTKKCRWSIRALFSHNMDGSIAIFAVDMQNIVMHNHNCWHSSEVIDQFLFTQEQQCNTFESNSCRISGIQTFIFGPNNRWIINEAYNDCVLSMVAVLQ